MPTTIDEIEKIAESMPDPFYRTIFLFLLKKIAVRNVFLRNEGLFEKYLNFEANKEKELNAKKTAILAAREKLDKKDVKEEN